jgi:hypothetical protein
MCSTVFEPILEAEVPSEPPPRRLAPIRAELVEPASLKPRRKRKSSWLSFFATGIVVMASIFVGLVVLGMMVGGINTFLKNLAPPRFAHPQLAEYEAEDFWYNWLQNRDFENRSIPTAEEWRYVQNSGRQQGWAIHYVRGVLYTESGDYIQARESFTRARQIQSMCRLALYSSSFEMIARFYLDEDPVALHQHFSEGVNPKDRDTLFFTLLPLIGDNETDLKLRYLDYYSAQNPDHPQILEQQSLLLLRQNQFDAAWKLHTRLPDGPLGDTGYNFVFLYEAARLGHLLAVYDRRSDADTVHKLFQTARNYERWDDLKELCRRWAKVQPNDPFLAQAEFWILRHEKKLAEAATRLAPVLDKFPEEPQREQAREEYFEVCLQLGRGFFTWVQLGREDEHLQQLRIHLLDKRDWGQITRLCHYLHYAGNHAQAALLAIEARLAADDREGALALLHRHHAADHLRDPELYQLGWRFAGKGMLIDIYNLCQDRVEAFSQLQYAGSIAAQVQLLDVYSQAFPEDVRVAQRWATLYLHRQDYAASWAYTQKVRARADEELIDWVNYQEQQLIVPLGKLQEYLHHPNVSIPVLLTQCVEHNRLDQAQLLLAHLQRQGVPLSPFQQLTMHWLTRDYDAVVRWVQTRGKRALHSDLRASPQLGYWYVLSLTRLGQVELALSEASGLQNNHWIHSHLELRIYAEVGDVQGFIVQAKKMPHVPSIYSDPYLRPFLRSPAFAEFRKQFPEPADLDDLDFLD